MDKTFIIGLVGIIFYQQIQNISMTIAIWNCICYNTPSLEMNFSEIGCMISVVKIIYGTGGSAVWDGKNAQGQRVASGVYTALCNTKTGTQHGSVKILIMN